MPNLSKRWQVAARLPPDAEGDLANFHPVLRQILYNRGYADEPSARQFIEARLPAAGDPAAEATLLGIDQSVERIRFAIQQGQPMAVYGDYDTDGVTATALLVECLKGLGADVREYIPNRFDEGYGLNNEALTSLHEQGTRLVITVDCGIRSVEEDLRDLMRSLEANRWQTFRMLEVPAALPATAYRPVGHDHNMP